MMAQAKPVVMTLVDIAMALCKSGWALYSIKAPYCK